MSLDWEVYYICETQRTYTQVSLHTRTDKTGQTDGWTDRQTDGWTDRQDKTLPACPDMVMALRLCVTPLVPELFGDALARGGLLPGTLTVVLSSKISLPWMSSI